MNKQLKLVILGIFVGVFLGSTLSNLQAIAATLFTVQTDTGTVLVSSTNGILPIRGGTGIKVSTIGSSVFINDTRIITTGQIEQIKWGFETQNNYLTAQMEMSSEYADQVKNTQPFKGNVTTVTITPIYNTMQNRMILTLFDNQTSTGKTITIPALSTTPIISNINQGFAKGDNLTWKITTITTEANSLLFNAQVMINYNG